MSPTLAKSSRLRLLSLVIANLLLPIAVLVFASGFFPYKPVLPGLATFSDDELVQQPEPVFDRIIFMVVDALRSDFVFGHGSGFTFTQSLIRSGAAIPFTAHAAPPTVTMPRVKALTTGSVPSFLDLILNFAESDTSSSLAAQDTWLAQLRAQGKTLVFYGDDTWLKLFPAAPPALVARAAAAVGSKRREASATEREEVVGGADGAEAEPFFARHDGTSSFFVSDFTQVDLNVTRHLPFELSRQPAARTSGSRSSDADAADADEDDWSAMILHYLGLDHIGHKTGPTGPNMLPKQREMDDVVRQIYTSMDSPTASDRQRRTLLVLAGDHGMNAGGNHGGSGPGETEPALVFISPRFAELRGERGTAAVAAEEGKPGRAGDATAMSPYECPTQPRHGTEFHYYTKVQQSDLIPTLAGLLGFPVSRNSLGVAIPELDFVWTSAERRRLARQNAAQIKGIVEATYGEAAFRRRVEEFARVSGHGEGERRCEALDEGESQLACLWAWVEAEGQGEQSEEELALRRFLLAAQESLSGVASSYNIPNMIIGMILAVVIIILTLLSVEQLWPLSTGNLFLVTTAVLYAIMMFASSYVEEEQHFWYWLTPIWIVLLAAIKARQVQADGSTQHSPAGTAFAALLALTVHRVAIRWNQTGQKHAGAPDIVHDFFTQSGNHVTLWLLILGAYGFVGVRLARRTFAGLVSPEVAALAAAGLVLPALVFKLNFTQADAPELVRGLAAQIRLWTAGWDLVAQARLAFALQAVAAGAVSVLSVASWRASKSRDAATGAKTVVEGALVGLLPSLTERLHVLLTLFLITQTRAPNVPLFLGMEAQRWALAHLLRSSTGRGDSQDQDRVVPGVVSALLFSHVYFFCMGGSNSISSIDLSNAYNGVADYNIVAVGVLLFASNWTAPIWWCSATVLLLKAHLNSRELTTSNVTGSSRSWIDKERAKLHADTIKTLISQDKALSDSEITQSSNVWRRYITSVTGFMAVSLLGVMAACTALRTHLFIWTVFSPKYLYAMAWSIGWHLLINVGLGSLLSALTEVS